MTRDDDDDGNDYDDDEDDDGDEDDADDDDGICCFRLRNSWHEQRNRLNYACNRIRFLLCCYTQIQ